MQQNLKALFFRRPTALIVKEHSTFSGRGQDEDQWRNQDEGTLASKAKSLGKFKFKIRSFKTHFRLNLK